MSVQSDEKLKPKLNYKYNVNFDQLPIFSERASLQ